LPASACAYRFNSDTFAFQCFEDEIVVLNLFNGDYYAFGGAAVIGWPYLVAQYSEPAIASALAGRYGVQSELLANDLNEFIEHLTSEQILLAAPENTAEIDCDQRRIAATYQGFQFERHSDLGDLLTLDPIHDVDPQKGWPYV
jgi:hypothetical protein